MAKSTKSVSAKKNVPVPPAYEAPMVPVQVKKPLPWRAIMIGIVVILVVWGLVNRGYIIAATVDGSPIFSWELNQTLRSRYGQQTLEGMIGETLIAKEAQKSGVMVSEDDLNKKQKEILSSLGTEVKLEDFLKFQGMTESDFNQQLKVQLMVERLLTKDLTISEADITNYIATNQATLTATDPAKLKEEARKAIIDNTVSEKLQAWFLQLREKARVTKFL